MLLKFDKKLKEKKHKCVGIFVKTYKSNMPQKHVPETGVVSFTVLFLMCISFTCIQCVL